MILPSGLRARLFHGTSTKERQTRSRFLRRWVWEFASYIYPAGGRTPAAAAPKGVVVAAASALVATLLFYLPALVRPISAGFLYTGDFWNVWLPLAAKTQSLVKHGVLLGVDFSTHGGASELFIRAGLFPYHPVLLLFSLLAGSSALETLMRFSVVILALHSFAAFYFSVRVGQKYLHLRNGTAIFLAAGFVFSTHTVGALSFPPFLLSTSLLPWIIYSALGVPERPYGTTILFASVPVFVTLVGGYSVIAFSCTGVASAFVLSYLLYLDKRATAAWRPAAARCSVAMAPFAIGRYSIIDQ